MSNFVIEIKAPEIVGAIKELVLVLTGNKGAIASDQPRQQVRVDAPVNNVGDSAPVVPTAPVLEQALPQQVMAPIAVPTAAQTYTMEQLAVSATQLMDAGRRDDVVGLLASFGVQALTTLAKEQYGAFATALRQMGAKI